MNAFDKEIYEMIENVFEYCGSSLLSLSDFDLEGVIYEDFMFQYTDLNEENLKILHKNKIISKDAIKKRPADKKIERYCFFV